MIPPRFAVDQKDIEGVVAAFYDQVRQDEVLGPVFAAHVEDWPLHEEKITRFWLNAILFHRVYDGNPMRAHMQAGNVQAAHFPRWLALFDATLHKQLPPEAAAQWSALAHRIGRGLSLGLTEYQRPPGTVPDLTQRL